MAAVTDEPDGTRTLTEADWNTKSSLSRDPYYYSKTVGRTSCLALRLRGKAGVQPGRDQPVHGHRSVAHGRSQHIEPGLRGPREGHVSRIIALTWGFVDVRDVAEAHVRAMERPAAHGRLEFVPAAMRFQCATSSSCSQRRATNRLPPAASATGQPTRQRHRAAGSVHAGQGSQVESSQPCRPCAAIDPHDENPPRARHHVPPGPGHRSREMEDLKRWGHLPRR